MSQRGAQGIVGVYLALKEGADADLLAMQMGDFYEFFADDAETVGRELDLKVSAKSSGGESYSMAGVPVDDLTPYLRALVERGYRVAVADQFEADGDIEREVTRVVTPGTLLESEDAEPRYLAAAVHAGDAYGVAFADVTTGRFHVAEVADVDDVLSECYRFDPVELLPGPELRNDDAFLARVRDETDAVVTVGEPNDFAPGAARHAVAQQFGAEAAESLGLGEPALRAAGAVLAYVEETGLAVSAAMTRLAPYRSDERVELDATTQRNLELTETMSPGADGALVDVIDHTATSGGGRLLRDWLTMPRRDVALLDRRQACVAALAGAALSRDALQESLSTAADGERIASRAAHGSATPRDLARARETLGLLPAVAERIEDDPRLSDSPLLDVLDRVDRERADALHETLDAALVDDPPGSLADGGVFRRGYDAELDDVVDRYEEAHGWIDTLAEREKRRLGITHLQVGRNRTDGYYLQVGQSETGKVPDEYREVKSLKSSKRYTTDDLDGREREVLRLEERRAELEGSLFGALRDEVAGEAAVLQDVGRALAEVDVYASFADHAAANAWVRPELGESGSGGTADGGTVDIEGGRHPVVEQTTEFVPNDVLLSDDRRFLIVTGPNMSGKSTYLRQTALIVLLAQVGSFVPAERARIDPVDGIFTRVGALDELAQGRSTFMVEMAELSRILHAATEDSLVILDEVGRGTSTYDGISIAWAATEYLASRIRAKTLFATHYHELAQLGDHLDGVHNVHVSADERDGDVTFLRTVREGPTDRSFGIHVAELAGVPDPVVSRANAVLAQLRADEAIDVQGSRGETHQVVFDLGSGGYRGEGDDAGRGTSTADGGEAVPLDPAMEAVLDDLRGTDVDEVTPVELMARVQAWQERLDDD